MLQYKMFAAESFGQDWYHGLRRMGKILYVSNM